MGHISLQLLIIVLVPWGVLCQNVAFFVARTSDAGPMSPLEFDYEGVNVGIGFDPVTNIFTAPVTGHYMFSMSAGIPAGATLEMDMIGPFYFASILRENANTNGDDTRSRTAIMELFQGEEVYITTYTPTTSDPVTKLTSWSGVLLESMLDNTDPSIFSAHRDTGFSEIYTPINFTQVSVNVGEDYETLAGAYQSPRNGSVFVTYSLGQEAGMQTECALLGDGHVSTLTRKDTTHGGTDMQSRHAMMSLIMYNYVWVQLELGSIHSDPLYQQAAMSGFMYEQVDGVNVAWSVQRESAMTAGDTSELVDFPVVRLNEGGAFEGPGGSTVTVPVSGWYYVFLDMASTWTPIQYKPVDVDLIHNGQVACSVRRTSTIHNNTDPLSRAILLYLDAGDQLWLIVNPMSAIHSDIDSQVAFTGFLAYAI